MDAGSEALFLRLISLGSSSLLQYVSESSPWAPGSARCAVDRVLALANEERDEVIRLTRLAQKKRLRVPASNYPSHFTTINFCSLNYLVPKLIAEQTREMAEVESGLVGADDEEVRALAQAFLDMKRGHLEALKDLTAVNAGAA